MPIKTDKDVSRGCLNTLPQNMKQSCLNNSDDCKICREPECNDKSKYNKYTIQRNVSLIVSLTLKRLFRSVTNAIQKMMKIVQN